MGRSSLLLAAEIRFADDPFDRGIVLSGSGANTRSSARLEFACGYVACAHSPSSDPIALAALAQTKHGPKLTRLVDATFWGPNDLERRR